MREYLFVLLVAAVVTYTLTPLVRTLAVRFGALTAVRERDVHAVPTPRLGGTAMFVGFAAAVAVGHAHRLRHYWRAFTRMPGFDLRNLLREEHSPFRWREIHRRTFSRYVSVDRLRRPETLPVIVGVTRLSDRRSMAFDLRHAEDWWNHEILSHLPGSGLTQERR